MKKLIYLFLIVYLSAVSIYLYSQRTFNSDIEAYIGLVYKNSNPKMDISSIHKKVYDELKTKNPKLLKANTTKQEETIGENTYYKIISENPKIYEEELQLFTVKPFYNFANLFFFKLGLKASDAVFAVSILSYALIVFLIFLFLKKTTDNLYLSLILTLLISIFKPLIDAGRVGTPDILSCLLLLVSSYCFLIKKDLLIATVFGMLCILTRPDYFVFYTLFLGLVYLFKETFNFKKRFLMLSFIYLFLSFALIQFFNQVSWSTLVMNQFIKVQLYPVSNPEIMAVSDYFKLIKSTIVFEFNASYFPFLLIFAGAILFKKLSEKSKNAKFVSWFILIIYLTVFIRFFIFPTLVNRMMLGFYLLIILALIYILNSSKDLFVNPSSKR